MLPIIQRCERYKERIAIVDAHGSYSYAQLRNEAEQVAINLLHNGLQAGSPVLYLIPSGYNYVVVQWGIWLAGGIAVPVHIAHPVEEIAYLLQDSGAQLFVYDSLFKNKVEAIPHKGAMIDLLALKGSRPSTTLPNVAIQEGAMLIYTSGTTGKPKGVLISHQQLNAQMESLTEAWEWSQEDYILNMLPMHHVHGVVNITCCALYNGATCEMYPNFDEALAFEIFGSGRLSLFMAVPTIYHKLIQYFEAARSEDTDKWIKGMRGMRLMVSGSAALPVSVLERWQSISGHTLLERYGMTEIGMALSNPLDGRRLPGFVGKPLPGVAVMLVDEQRNAIETADTAGQLYIKGETVFKQYWRRPIETAQAFDKGWFKTGDIASKDEEGNFRILGRSSTDIIKSGGYKISALEIEQVLLEHPMVQECAIVALPDEEWGECIAAAYVGSIAAEELKQWIKEKLAPYKVPRKWIALETLPRNAMGKLVKPTIKTLFDY
jgi:malonyl-CoA/methylmalonyl-CoA synthetase